MKKTRFQWKEFLREFISRKETEPVLYEDRECFLVNKTEVSLLGPKDIQYWEKHKRFKVKRPYHFFSVDKEFLPENLMDRSRKPSPFTGEQFTKRKINLLRS